MKTQRIGISLALLLSIVSGVLPSCAQGSFKNLGFESPILPLVTTPPLNTVSVSRAVPYWAITLGTNLQSEMLYNNASLGTAAVSLLGPASSQVAFQGDYMVLLQSGKDPQSTSPFDRVAASIQQEGAIPSDAASLRFLAALGPFGRLEVSFASQVLSVFQLGVGSGYVEYGLDVMAFRGATGILRFSAPDIGIGPNNIDLDGIHFSTQPIPEPSAVALFGLGMAFISWRTRNCRRT